MILKKISIHSFCDNYKREKITQYEYNVGSFAFELYDSKENPVNISECISAVYYGTKADGTLIGNECEIADNKVIITPTLQMTSCAGLLKGIIECQFESGNIRFYGIDFEIQPAPVKAEIESKEEFTVLDKTLAEVKELLVKAENGEFNGADGADGKDGADGIGITNSEINASGELVITYSDGAVANLGVVVGADGKDGVNGVDGQDYILTEEDKTEIANAALEDIKTKLSGKADYEMTCLLTISGYYNKETKNDTSTRFMRVYDVNNISKVTVSGNFMAYSNTFTLLDSDFNVLDYHFNNTAGTVSFLKVIDVTEARWLLVGSGTATDASISVIADNYQKVTNYIQHLNGEPKMGFYQDSVWNSTSSSPSVLYDVTGTDHVIITANADTWFNLYTFTDFDGNILQSDRSFSGNTTVFLPIPDGAKKLYVATSTANSDSISVKTIKTFDGTENQWTNKKIVWFGTSIPAGGYIGDSSVRTYPKMIADMLGADIYNESVGSSCLHCKKPDRVNPETNPYGFIENFEAASRCLTNSLEEMQWIIDNYNSDIWTVNKVSTMTDTLKAQILNNSWEKKLKKYLTASTEPALFVFDHGHNDPINSLAVEQSYYEQYGEDSLYTFRGAFNFIIKKILQFNIYAKIVMIGEYSGTDESQINAMQLQSAQDWNLPILKNWEKLGWSKTKTIVRNGHWEKNENQYTWVTDETYQPITVFNSWIADGVHPHSSPTDKPLRHMADTIGNWLLNDVTIS